MASNKSLRYLSKQLKLSEQWLKNLNSGGKRKENSIITINTANACRAVAQFTGYKSAKTARKAITSNILLLHYPSEKLSARITKLSNKYGKETKETLLKAAQALKGLNFTEYRRIIKKGSKSANSLMAWDRLLKKNCDKKLLDRLRSYTKTSRAAAKQLLKSVGAPNGYKIIVPQSAIDKEVERRMQRYGSIGSLFWTAAKKLNPKIKANKLPAEKRKKRNFPHGASYKIEQAKLSATVTINHFVEKKNSKFRSRLDKTIKQQEKFWAKQCEKQITAATVIKKLLKDT